MSLHFTDMEWEIADEAYANVLERCKREGRLMGGEDKSAVDEVAEEIARLNREARHAFKWRKRAMAAEKTLRTIGVEPLEARRAASPRSQP